MKIKMKTLLAGPAGIWAVGSMQTVAAQQGQDLIAGGFADLVEADVPEKIAETPAPVEPPAEKTPESSTRRNPKPKKGQESGEISQPASEKEPQS